GSVQCTGANPPTPYQQCLNDHNGYSSFKINDVPCFCADDGTMQCTGITPIPAKYQQCLSEHNGSAAFTLGGIGCFCLQDGTIQCLGKAQEPNKYQWCLRNHGGQAAFKENDKDCFYGSVQCTGVPPVDPNRPCTFNPSGSNTWTESGQICTCLPAGTVSCIVPLSTAN
ncbi:hypothetical protein BB558_006806, partial [Smittium angustum]